MEQHVVRLKHLPDEADSTDIRKFFKKVDIPDGGVRILGGEKGVVYITVTSESDLKRALERDGKKLHPSAFGSKSKRVKISESTSREMQRAIEEIVHGPDVARQMRRERERAVTPPAPGDVYVELGDLPQDTGLKEIVSFFAGLSVTQVKLVGDGQAYVQFKNVDMKQEALTYDLRFMSSKFVHVRHLLESIWDGCEVPIIKNSKSKMKELTKQTTQTVSSSSDKKKSDAKKSSDEKKESTKEKKEKTGACVQVSGLTKSVNKKMIVHDIFKGYKITNYGLYIETENGICTGKCYIEFISPEVRSSAVKSTADRRIEGVRIKVVNISHDEMETKVRQHRKFLKQSQFLKRQAAKERQANEQMKEKRAPTPEEERNEMVESSSADSPTPEAGLKPFYGDYNESRFDQSSKDVISVGSTPEKSPIEINSNSDNDEDFTKTKKVEKFKPKKKIQMNLKKKDAKESVISRLEREEKEKAPSPQPEPDSTTSGARMESETSEEESEKMPFNPMQMMMMQQMMMQFHNVPPQPPVDTNISAFTITNDNPLKAPYSSIPAAPVVPPESSNRWPPVEQPPVKKTKLDSPYNNSPPPGYAGFATGYRGGSGALVHPRPPAPPPVPRPGPPPSSTFVPPRGHFPGDQPTRPRNPDSNRNSRFDRPRFDEPNNKNGRPRFEPRGMRGGFRPRGGPPGGGPRGTTPPRVDGPGAQPLQQRSGWTDEPSKNNQDRDNRTNDDSDDRQKRSFGQRGGNFPPRGSFPSNRGNSRPNGPPGGGGGSFRENNPPRGGDSGPPTRGQFRPRGDNFRPRGGDFRPRGGDFRPRGGDSRPRGGDFRPRGGDFRPRGGPPRGGGGGPRGGGGWNPRGRGGGRGR